MSPTADISHSVVPSTGFQHFIQNLHWNSQSTVVNFVYISVCPILPAPAQADIGQALSSQTWSNWRCGWLAPDSRGPHSGAEGSRRIGLCTCRNLSCLHLSAHKAATVTMGQSLHLGSHFAPADPQRGEEAREAGGKEAWDSRGCGGCQLGKGTACWGGGI